MNLNYHSIIHNTVVDGPGNRSVIFLQGCTLACPGCQSRHLWPTQGGTTEPTKDLASRFVVEAKAAQGNPPDSPRLTISGGEPFQQAAGLAEFVAALRDEGTGHIIVYSGYRYEELVRDCEHASYVFEHIDVLVDGRYDHRQDSASMQYRGSQNQRPIDMRQTLAAGRLVVLDWDTPEIIIDLQGNFQATGPMIALLEQWQLGTAQAARRCGQST